MKGLKKKFMTRIIIACFIIIGSGITGFARLNNNEAGGGYNSPGVAYSMTNLIEKYIIDGAGFYFCAVADIQSLFRFVELQDNQGLDFNQLTRLVDNALIDMNNARESYQKLIENAEVTPYNENIQIALKKFDYNGFMLSNRLNGPIFGNVEKYLGSGDITGALKMSYSYFTAISDLLNIIKTDVSLTRLPSIEIFWRLNEVCAETSLFGSYGTKVFFALR